MHCESGAASESPAVMFSADFSIACDSTLLPVESLAIRSACKIGMPLCSIVPRMRAKRAMARFRKICPGPGHPQPQAVGDNPAALRLHPAPECPEAGHGHHDDDQPPLRCRKWLNVISPIVSAGSSPFSSSFLKIGSNRGTKKMTSTFSTMKPTTAKKTG